MAEQFVRNTISDGKVTVFVRGGCPYCRNAVEMLMWYNITPGHLQVIDITGLPHVQDHFQRTQGQRGVPCVFFGTECVGGLRDLMSLRRNLPRILQHIGAIHS
ncbi:glutaredoxin-1 [Pterocles gutturalis]